MATRINNIRLRAGAIVAISIGIHIIREYTAPGVVKATRLLSFNYFAYAIILLLSIVPHKSAWGTAVIFQVFAAFNDIFSVTLGTIATARCLSSKQTGCIELALQSVLCLFLLGVVTLMDGYQLWNIYLCLRQKMFRSSAAQRVRILFAWALPFGWLVNIVHLSESNITLMATPHLVVDPIMIMMARSREPMFLGILCAFVFATDVLHYMFATSTLVINAIFIQATLTLFAGGVLAFSLTYKKDNPKSKSGKLPPVANIVVPAVSANARANMRHRKSKKLEF